MMEFLKKMTNEEKFSIIGVFLTVLGCYFGYSGLDGNIGIIISAIISAIGAIILLIQDIKYYKQGLYTDKQKKIFLILSLLGLVVFYRADVYYVSLIVVANFINKDLKKLMYIIFYSSLVSLGLILLLCLFKVTTNISGSKEFFGLRIKTNSFGFCNPNVLYRFFGGIVLTGLFIFKDNIIYVLSSLLLGIGLFFLTGSRAGIVCLFVLTLLCLMPRKVKEKVYNVKALPYIFLFFVIVSILCALLLNEGVANKLGSNRFSLWYDYFREVSLISHLKKLPQGPLDNAFINILYYGGIYGLILYCFIYFLAFMKSNKKRPLIFIIFLATFVYGFFENFSAYGESRLFIVLLVMLLNEDKLDDFEKKLPKISCQ